MKRSFAAACGFVTMVILLSSPVIADTLPSELKLSREELLNKIKGGWAGQTIGVTYGGPTEFKYRGIMIDDGVEIPWPDDEYIVNTMQGCPELYDDIYMDLTFVDMIDRYGIDVPVDTIALAFANAPYMLWHANQAARYNILHGIMPPMSGHWINNPHADDIDYQIEADYAGLMCPGMPNSASVISDRIGHIMCYGDGWYGGIYVGAMYAIAFVTDDIETIVTEALKTIPPQSRFHRCIKEVIECWKSEPDDWKKAWQMCRERWNEEVACADGVLRPFNIDAVINSAYVTIGLLYGHGDFGRTIDIATRCGQDSDCNPASAAGVLGTAYGYTGIPEKWLSPLKKAENIKFVYTDMSLADIYSKSFSHALQMIEDEGGSVGAEEIDIKVQQPRPVAFEQSFPGLEPIERQTINKVLDISSDSLELKATCKGFLLEGLVKSNDTHYVAELELWIDGSPRRFIEMPGNYHDRRLEIFGIYDLDPGNHVFLLKWLNPDKQVKLEVWDAVIY